MEKILDRENFVRRLLVKLGFNIIQEQSYIQNHRSDFVVSKAGIEYEIEIKNHIELIKIYERKEKIENTNRKHIVIIFTSVSNKARIRARDVGLDLIDVPNLLYIVQDDEELLSELISLLNFSIDSIDIQKPEGNIFRKIRKDKLSSLDNDKEKFIRRLELIQPGIEHREYEMLMGEILKKIFNNELQLFLEQPITDEELNRFDMICKIKNDVSGEFFQTIEKFYNTKYILFEFKNYSDKITQREVCTTEKYLYDTALRNVAIIFSRRGINENGLKMIKGILRETGKLMIVMNDDDVKKMLDMYDKGEKASDLIMNKLDELLVGLEK